MRSSTICIYCVLENGVSPVNAVVLFCYHLESRLHPLPLIFVGDTLLKDKLLRYVLLHKSVYILSNVVFDFLSSITREDIMRTGKQSCGWLGGFLNLYSVDNKLRIIIFPVAVKSLLKEIHN